MATLRPKQTLKLLDLTELIEEDCTEFESLDLSIQMLFLASKHSYEISKELSVYVKEKDFDGIIYPSFFSLVRTGKIPFPTVYGISTRKIPEYKEIEKSRSKRPHRTVRNLRRKERGFSMLTRSIVSAYIITLILSFVLSVYMP